MNTSAEGENETIDSMQLLWFETQFLRGWIPAAQTQYVHTTLPCLKPLTSAMHDGQTEVPARVTCAGHWYRALSPFPPYPYRVDNSPCPSMSFHDVVRLGSLVV